MNVGETEKAQINGEERDLLKDLCSYRSYQCIDQAPQRAQSRTAVKKVNIVTSIVGECIVSPFISACSNIPQEKRIEFIYLALGASDVIGVGAMPLTEGYVYLINQDLQQRIPGTFSINLGVPAARLASLSNQVRLAKRFHGKADVATVWIGANNPVHGDDPPRFQSELRELLRSLQSSGSTIVVIANLGTRDPERVGLGFALHQKPTEQYPADAADVE